MAFKAARFGLWNRVCVCVSADKHFWLQGYTLISKDVEDCVPIFLRHFANDVYVCGKNINLLKICCPQVSFTFWRHFILLLYQPRSHGGDAQIGTVFNCT